MGPPQASQCNTHGTNYFLHEDDIFSWSAGATEYLGRVEIPVSATYNPTGSPSTWYWQLRYNTTASVQAVDTITVTVSLRGAPAHLLSS